MKYILFLLILISIGAKAQTGFSNPVAYSNPADSSKHKCQHVYVRVEQDTIRYDRKGWFPGPSEELICIICHKRTKQVIISGNQTPTIIYNNNRFKEAAKKAAEQTSKTLSQ